ncbi:MAG: methyltransferase domain-containing protein [Candidatus Cloacimonetes bacterium]|nr:methyltransferase domain-containing protein [Candidatus Cloacimonadota bacterium]
MPMLSDYAQKKKIDFFLKPIPETAHILEIGSGDGWVGKYLKTNNWQNYLSIDINPPADIIGNILDWEKLCLNPNFFDYIIAFEVVEHVDCFQACYDLLKSGGKLLLTSPVPGMDWLMKIFETMGLNQKRTSPHDHLVDFKTISVFSDKQIKIIAGLSQWGIFTRD